MNEYEKVKPRYEFRTFSPDFDTKLLNKVRHNQPSADFRQSEEIYIMSRGNNINNTKLRDNKMDIKCYIETKEGFEQWNPHAKFKFPLAATRIKDELFPTFSVECPELNRDEYTQDQFVNELINTHPELSAANVHKKRFGTTICNCIAEYAEVLINGSPLQSISIESTELKDLNSARDHLALNDHENINYLVAIKRVIGMLSDQDRS